MEQEATKVFLAADQKLAIATWIFEAKEILFGKLANDVTSGDKVKAWDSIFTKCQAKAYHIPDAKYLRKVHLNQAWAELNNFY